ncbi:efflux RND transporter periplasmic adaptor subunit [Lentisphaerota bacterium WC36G]|nr:efflux RND transporter periplasmic adaptor subunit [Lentisphaerae bacterium WC36]
MKFYSLILALYISFLGSICSVKAKNLSNNNSLTTKSFQTIKFNGMQVKAILSPIQEIIVARRISSKIDKYNFKVGERFKEGDVLVNINATFFEFQHRKAQAATIEAQKNEAYWRNRIVKEKDMYKDGIGDKATIEKAILEHEICKSKLAVSKNDLFIANLNLKECKIIAPFSGRLVEKTVRDGEHFRDREPLMTIINDNQVLAVMYLPSFLRTKLNQGDAVSVMVEETMKKYTGKIYTLSAKIDPRSKTFEVKVVIDNKDGLLSSGMSAVLVADSETIFKSSNNYVANNNKQ